MDFEILLKKLNFELKQIRTQNTDKVQQANLSILTCRKVLSDMSQSISTTCFINEIDEIHFFKKVKVLPLSQLIYFSEIRSLEIQYPKASKVEQKKYLERKIKKANKFFGYNIEFIQYAKDNKTHHDSVYYTRKNYNSLNITDTKNYYRAPEFSTSHDILLGKVMGYDLLINYLQNRLYNLQNPQSVNLHDMHKKSRLKWTSSKVALTELIYALHSSGAVNSGAADIREIATIAEKIFNVELGDYYRTFLELRSRKVNQTKFIDKLKESLIQRMEESDE